MKYPIRISSQAYNWACFSFLYSSWLHRPRISFYRERKNDNENLAGGCTCINACMLVLAFTIQRGKTDQSWQRVFTQLSDKIVCMHDSFMI